jgi:SAM-dependent methyltransferase
VRRLGNRTEAEALEYHLRRNDVPDFTAGQPGRIDLAHFLIEKILVKDLTRRPLRVVELGCGSGDVTGPFAGPAIHGGKYTMPRGTIDLTGINVVGIDVVPAAVRAMQRFPEMDILISPVEELQPFECDLLVMTEFLEHVIDPVTIVHRWLPLAKWAIIGHPLDEPDPPYEYGHNWSYTLQDWHGWFELGGHHVWERFLFPMGYWDNMVMGHSCRNDQPPLVSS